MHAGRDRFILAWLPDAGPAIFRIAGGDPEGPSVLSTGVVASSQRNDRGHHRALEPGPQAVPPSRRSACRNRWRHRVGQVGRQHSDQTGGVFDRHAERTGAGSALPQGKNHQTLVAMPGDAHAPALTPRVDEPLLMIASDGRLAHRTSVRSGRIPVQRVASERPFRAVWPRVGVIIVPSPDRRRPFLRGSPSMWPQPLIRHDDGRA